MDGIADILRRLGMVGITNSSPEDVARDLISLLLNSGQYTANPNAPTPAEMQQINDVVSRMIEQKDTIIADDDAKKAAGLPPSGPTVEGLLGGLGSTETLLGRGETAEGREDILRAALGRQMGPTPTPFLEAAGRRLFDPIQASFRMQQGLGQLPGQWDPGTESILGGGPTEGGPGLSFSEFINQEQGLPTQQALQDQLRQTAGLFGQEELGRTQRGFVERLSAEPNRQFQLALSSVLQNIPLGLRQSFSNWAGDQFRQFRGTTPEQQFLPQFVGADRIPSRQMRFNW